MVPLSVQQTPKSVCVTTNIHQQQESPCEVSLCRKVYLVFILGTTLCPEVGRTSTCWSVGRQPGVRELLLKHLRKKQGCRSAKTFFTVHSAKQNLDLEFWKTMPPKTARLASRKNNCFPGNLASHHLLPFFPGVEADGHQSQPRDKGQVSDEK